MKEKTTVITYICFSLLHGFVATLNCSSPTPPALFQALETELFPNNLLRPVKHFSDILNVSIEMKLLGILGVDEKAQSLTLFIWQGMEWDIAGLSWDEKECGTTGVSIPREKLWIPDIRISEFMGEDESPKTPYVYLYNTGRVYDGKPIRVVSSCRLVIYTFPFDIQNCSLTFGSYIHFATDIRTFASTATEDTLAQSRNVIQTEGEWQLVDIEVAPSVLEISAGSFSEIKYYVILRRVPTLYLVNLIIPSSFLVALDLFSFLLPPQSVDRSTFKMTLILGYTVFLLIVNDLLPATGNETPLINVLFSLSLALMVASLLETVFIVHIQFTSSQYGRVPHWLSVLVLRYIAVLVCFPAKKRNRVTVSLPQHTKVAYPDILSSRNLQMPDSEAPPVRPTSELTLEELRKLSRDLMAIRQQIDNQSQGTIATQEWQMIGMVIDRLLFGFYLIFLTVSLTVISILWHQQEYTILSQI